MGESENKYVSIYEIRINIIFYDVLFIYIRDTHVEKSKKYKSIFVFLLKNENLFQLS